MREGKVIIFHLRRKGTVSMNSADRGGGNEYGGILGKVL